MLFLLFAYLLLAAPLSGKISANIDGLHGEAAIGLTLAGMTFERLVHMQAGENGWPFSSAPLFGAPQEKKSGKAPDERIQKSLERLLRKTAKVQAVDVSMRIGLDEAWSTALAAGGARAAVFSALGFLPSRGDVSVCVTPDFFSPCFCVSLRCIFSVTIGDIVLSAVNLKRNSAAGKGFFHAAASH